MFKVKFRELLMQTPGAFEEFDALCKQLNAFLLVAHNDDGTLETAAVATAATGSALSIGDLVLRAGPNAPPNALLCNGATISRATYRALFDEIGTAWGVGDSSTTFNLPDFRGRAPYGVATAGTGSTLGASFGAMDHTHAGPSHTHTSTTVNVVVAGAQAVATSPTNASGTANTGTANPPGAAVYVYIVYA